MFGGNDNRRQRKASGRPRPILPDATRQIPPIFIWPCIHRQLEADRKRQLSAQVTDIGDPDLLRVLQQCI